VVALTGIERAKSQFSTVQFSLSVSFCVVLVRRDPAKTDSCVPGQFGTLGNICAPAKPKNATKGAKPAKKATPAKKVAKKTGGKATERNNKKAEVIAMMKRAKGVTLAEIMQATGWQAHTIRGFVSILGSKAGEKIESSKSASGERTYPIGARAIATSGALRRAG
jgi:hypothetical protein